MAKSGRSFPSAYLPTLGLLRCQAVAPPRAQFFRKGAVWGLIPKNWLFTPILRNQTRDIRLILHQRSGDDRGPRMRHPSTIDFLRLVHRTTGAEP